MAEVSAQMVKQLREMTGAGFNECRTALAESAGDLTKAVEYLRKKGAATAAKKSGRVANDGIVQTYMHHNGRLGVIVEVNSETDFVARNEQFRQFAKDLALHIANAAPRYIRREDIPQEIIEKERRIQLERTLAEGKSEAVAAKIVDGRMNKWYEEIVLMEQPWFFDDSKKVSEVLTDLIAEIKENIVVRRFARFELGEGVADEAAE
ncbi:MAG: translation elongation factor Ts [Candidatus Thermofonsia Clade 1 bacterium]|uniref:Elongation factor Ts n=1 Tax=Candidatus Thermofonsia Clade 1 bacterium TaxID=2364210 RepID=A0A2M8PZI5_9CHLR|nr:MAG: translation elongation factor Ts [Candidatus Thermofonsia Clade 1 bacterium]PJF42955.1 MAG: translation elongation factor Ts [Candidatus Thermofonsia Clade 1 bacterium]RMF53720.1 MAG: translation elongation factor Ts [Chloroflexota bacterium]